jgi:hypothetical protein
VTWAYDADEFRHKAETIAATLDMYVAGIEEAEPLIKRAADGLVTEELEEMVLQAESNPNATIYGTFHGYPFDEA